MTSRRTAAIGGMRRNIRTGGVVSGATTGQAYAAINALLGVNLRDALDSELNVGLVSTDADTWTTQKLGIVLSAAAAGNRTPYGADGSNFNGRSVIQAAVSGTKWLRVLDAGLDIISAVAQPYVFVIGRQRTLLTGNAIVSLANGVTPNLYAFASTGGADSVLTRTAGANQTILSGAAYVSTVKMLEFWNDANGVNVRKSLGTTYTNALGIATTDAIRRLTVGANASGAGANDFSFRFIGICTTKPSDALLTQVLAYFATDSGCT